MRRTNWRDCILSGVFSAALMVAFCCMGGYNLPVTYWVVFTVAGAFLSVVLGVIFRRPEEVMRKNRRCENNENIPISTCVKNIL